MNLPPGADQRREAALAGHRGDADSARRLLDHHEPSVRATAVGALARIGALTGVEAMASLSDADPLVRARVVISAIPLVGATTPDGPVSLLPLLEDPDPSVVEQAAFACGECEPPEPGATAALAAVATTHVDPLCRESAVAALGAVGDRSGLPAILAACRDKPAVRRRAVLALAPFDGPEVDAALAAALEDRDWQVREAAEALLDEA